MFDRDELMDLTGGDGELARELVDTFLADLPKQRAEIRDATARADLPSVHRTAHTLKGAVGNFAAHDAFEAARQVDELARSHQQAGLAEAVARLETALDQLAPALRTWADTL